MRTINESTTFRRDYKRERKGQHRATIVADLTAAVIALAADSLLEPRLRDHALSGDWSGYRECHLRPDLLLNYRKVGDHVLTLIRLGSHSELF